MPVSYCLDDCGLVVEPEILKQLEKEEIKNPRVSRRKEILKIRAEINVKETKETIAKINKAKS